MECKSGAELCRRSCVWLRHVAPVLTPSIYGSASGALGASIAAGGSRLNYSRSRHKNLTDIMMRFLGEEGQARLAALYSAGRAGPSSGWPGLDA